MSEILIKEERPTIEELFAPYREMIGKDYPGYRNHVYRTVTYAMHFLDQGAGFEKVVETAMVYHDIGLWSDHALAYLEPSEALVAADNQRLQWGLDEQVLKGIIHWHHKIFPYRGDNAQVIEACRKADWVDASKGMLRKGLPRHMISTVEDTFPNLGFHQSLMRLAKDYGGSTLVGAIRVTRGIVKW